MVKTATPAPQAAEEKKATAPVVTKKKFTVAANGKKVPAAGTIAKPPVKASAPATAAKKGATAAPKVAPAAANQTDAKATVTKTPASMPAE